MIFALKTVYNFMNYYKEMNEVDEYDEDIINEKKGRETITVEDQ